MFKKISNNIDTMCFKFILLQLKLFVNNNCYLLRFFPFLNIKNFFYLKLDNVVHTPTSSDLGMIAIGAGGMSVAMAGQTFPLVMPLGKFMHGDKFVMKVSYMI